MSPHVPKSSLCSEFVIKLKTNLHYLHIIQYLGSVVLVDTYSLEQELVYKMVIKKLLCCTRELVNIEFKNNIRVMLILFRRVIVRTLQYFESRFMQLYCFHNLKYFLALINNVIRLSNHKRFFC
jgi:hypothetical protein